MNPSSGVVKQMEWEQDAARNLDLPWRTVLHTAKDISSEVAHIWRDLPDINIIRYFVLRKKFYRWLEINSKHYDVVLLRFSVHDPWQKRLARKIGRKLLLVHHTKEERELAGAGGALGHIKMALEVVWGRRTLKSSLATISVTPEIALYEKSRAQCVEIKPGFYYPNGINYTEADLSDLRAGDVPQIVFIASNFAPWHGLDLLILETKKCADQFRIHLVGDVSAADTTAIAGDDRFVLHGCLRTSEIQSLTKKMWIGLSSFAMFRNGMQQACTLKVREYLMMGLPVYAGHQDAGLPDDFAFYKNGPLRLSDILSYARQTRSVSRADVSSAAEPYISKGCILSRLYAQLEMEIFPKLSSYVAQPCAPSNELQGFRMQGRTSSARLVAVTGASGFIGGLLVDKLLQLGFRVRALSRQQTNSSRENLSWVVGDLTSTRDWSGFVDGVDILVHAAAELHRAGAMQAVNFCGSLRLLQEARSAGVKRWVQLSSVGAYGSVSDGWVTEDSPTEPQGAYEVSKTRFDESLVETLKGSTTEYCIVRPSNVYGPGMRNQALSHIQRMLGKGWFAYIGPAGASANYVHVDDVVNAVAKAAVHPAASNQTYIVSDWTTLENMVVAMAQSADAAEPRTWIPLWIAKAAAYGLIFLPKFPLTPSRVRALSNRSRYSTKKIEKELDWNVTVPVVSGVRHLVSHKKMR
jgi:nucleoside-diphosphate-sugar epimerase